MSQMNKKTAEEEQPMFSFTQLLKEHKNLLLSDEDTESSEDSLACWGFYKPLGEKKKQCRSPRNSSEPQVNPGGPSKRKSEPVSPKRRSRTRSKQRLLEDTESSEDSLACWGFCKPGEEKNTNSKPTKEKQKN